MTGRIAIVVKGYPRLSETFIAQEILGLERRGVEAEIWALRRPTDGAVHPLHKAIEAPVRYLPEYLHEAPGRVLRGLAAALRRPGFGAYLRAGLADLRRDPSPNRMRRLGQALVLARELPEAIRHMHVHYLHTPASVVRYASLIRGGTWSFSAHAKDIWTTPGRELADKIAAAAWGVTCTRDGAARLDEAAGRPGAVRLLYHGLDLERFPPPPAGRPRRDGSDPADPVRILSVGRAVAKKGYDDLLRALAALPPDLSWRFAHVGTGERIRDLKALAQSLGIADRVIFLGAKTQPDVVALLREADLFCLPAKAGPAGDRDGLPNVLMEAASQELPIVATAFGGIAEFVRDGVDGVLVPPGDWGAVSNAVNLLARDPDGRARFAASAYARLRSDFSAEPGLDWLASRLGGEAIADRAADAA